MRAWHTAKRFARQSSQEQTAARVQIQMRCLFFFPSNMLSFIVSLSFSRKQTPNQHSNDPLVEKIHGFPAGCLRCVCLLSHFRPHGGTLENCFFQIQIRPREKEWLISRYIKNKFPREHDMTWNRQFTYAAKVIHSQANLSLIRLLRRENWASRIFTLFPALLFPSALRCGSRYTAVVWLFMTVRE